VPFSKLTKFFTLLVCGLVGCDIENPVGGYQHFGGKHLRHLQGILKAICSSLMLGITCKFTRHHNPEHNNRQFYCRKNKKSRVLQMLW
jgi:hypothetical protein